MEEKRKSIRIKRSLIFRAKDIAGVSRVYSISNLNQEGICFISPDAFPEGESIEVSLKLPTRPNEWHQCRCKVLESKDITKFPGAFVSGWRTRVKFESVAESTAVFLKEYCDLAVKQNQKLERTFQELLGAWEKEKEKRTNIRIHKSIVAMYKSVGETDSSDWDITTIRNISTGGVIFTAKIGYRNFAHLELLLKIPLEPFNWVTFSGKVVESKRLKNLEDFEIGGTYLTRLEFFSVPVENRELLERYIDWFAVQLNKPVNPGFM